VKGFALLLAIMVLMPAALWAGDAVLPDNIIMPPGGGSQPQRVLQAGPPVDVLAPGQITAPQQVTQSAAPEIPKSSSAPADASQLPATSQAAGQPETSGEAPPMGQSTGSTGSSGDLLEKKSNIVHPFLAVGGYFTDNVNNSHTDRKSDFGMVLSPGVYFALPGMRQRITPTGTLNIAPGGANLTGFRPDYAIPLQSYLYYRADIEAFANNSSLNTVSHLVEGVVQSKFRGGLNINFEDQFKMTHNQRGTGLSFGLDKFYDNLASISAKYQLGEKTLARLDYSNYYLHFLGAENSFRDRDDNRVAAYFFYKMWPRTSVFAEYEYVNSAYSDKTVSGSMEHHIFVGVRYDVTDKTRGMIKVGYGIKDFERSSLRSQSNIYAEAQLDHKFTEKTSIILTASRRTDETDVATAYSIVENTIDATYLQRLTTKLTASINFRFTDEKYNGNVTYAGVTKMLHDEYIRTGASMLYEFRDWINFTVGYYFTDRMSNINSLSYTSNNIFFRISAIY